MKVNKKQNNNSISIKLYAINIAVIVMSICYVFGPSHNEINKFFHLLTHQLEMPDNLIKHSTTLHSNHKEHVTHQVNKSIEVHNHKLLQFFNNIFKASNTDNDSDNSEIVHKKIDKHLSNKQYFKTRVEHSNFKFQENFAFIKQKVQKGFNQRIIEPPQLS